MPVLPKLMWKLQYLLFNSSVPGSCKIGEGTKFGYGGIGLVIHARAEIGKNCVIGANVTIGGKSGWWEVPIIGDNVEISAGSRIIGPVRIGDNVVIGANTVVLRTCRQTVWWLASLQESSEGIFRMPTLRK